MLTTSAVTSELQVSRATISRWVKTGFPTHSGEVVRLEAVRVGRGLRFRREDLDSFLGACRVPLIKLPGSGRMGRPAR